MESLTENRTWPRKDCLLNAFLNASHEPGNIKAYITDISCGGMRLRPLQKIKEDTPLTVGFSLQGDHLTVNAKIKWREDGILGLQFDHPFPHNVEKYIFDFVNAP